MRFGPRTALVVAIAAILLGASLLLALHRTYGMDEVQNAFWARIIGSGTWAEYETGTGIYLLGPLASLARRASRSATLLVELRIVFLCLFWVNVLLLARLAGARIRSGKGLTILFGAATLAPLWDFGMDIRHDNVLLFGLLFIWSTGRQWITRLGATWAYGAIGFAACWMELTHFKGFIYAVPACAILILFPHPSVTRARYRLAIALAGGSLAGLACGWAIHTIVGTWPIAVASVTGGLRFSSQMLAKGPPATIMILPSHTAALERMTTQTPLLVGGFLSFLCFCIWELRKRGGAWFNGATSCPETLLALSAFGAFIVNPTPFPYILVLVVPQVFLAVSQLAPIVSRGLAVQARIIVPFAVTLLIAQLLPFVSATLRHEEHLNTRQIEIADLAEQLTDPQKDRVWDAMGLVTTRESIGFHWYFIGMNIRYFLDGTWPPVREMLVKNPAPVIIRNYRTDWLPSEDKEFIKRHYIALSDELLVLGATLRGPESSWTCLHAGRYFLATPGNGEPKVLLDGLPIAANPVSIEAGAHTLSMSIPSSMIVWVGPRLQRPPTLSKGDHRTLFAGWY